MVKIKLMNEIFHGPIWYCELDSGLPTDSLEFVARDKKIEELNCKIQDMYDSYYEFESHGQPVWFNLEQEKKDKQKMLDLLAQLNARLDEINDGSFVVEDRETPRVRAL